MYFLFYKKMVCQLSSGTFSTNSVPRSFNKGPSTNGEMCKQYSVDDNSFLELFDANTQLVTSGIFIVWGH